MTCRFYGGGDEWIKNCIRKGHRAPGWEWWPRSFRCCDPCYEARHNEPLIVPGPSVVTARCVGCGTDGNPRGFEDVRPAGRTATAGCVGVLQAGW